MPVVSSGMQLGMGGGGRKLANQSTEGEGATKRPLKNYVPQTFFMLQNN
jgi:hypothetical protein